MANPSRVVNGCGITMTSSTSHNTLTIGQPSSSPSLSPASSPGLAGTTTCPPSTSPGMLNQMMMMMNTTTTTPVAPGAGTASAVTNNDNHHQGPYVRIIEQPARCALRFRYECEGRSAGSIPGANATPENKTYPTIQVESFKGPAVVVVSCVTKDFPYRPHPHNLVGKDGCKKGVCTMVINNPDMICSFTSLGIQCVKRKDIEESLKLRETIKVDPFRTGFAHKNQASNIDLNVVRLCFQVFIEGPEKDKFTVPLPPVVSDPIYDKKAMSDLIITKLSHCSAPVTGSKEIILLCDRVAKDDIQVRFYEDKNGQTVWEGYADFQPNDVHKQVAISFRSPKYYNENIHQPIMVNIQLRRPSDGHTSESRPFQFLPKEVDPDGLARKRQKIEETRSIDRYLKDNTMISHMQQQPQQQQQQQQHSMSTLDYPSTSRSPFMPQQPPSPRIPDRIKIEVTESQHQKLQQQLQQQQQKLQTPMQWNDLSTGSSMIPFGSPSYQHNMMSVPSPTSVSHSIQEPTTQSTSSALPQTIPNSLSPSFSVSSSPRVSVDMSNQPLTIQQQLQQQQQQQQQQQPKQTLHLQHSQQSQSSFLAAQSNLNQNIILADSNQMTSNNFGTSPSNNMLQRGERQYIKNLDHSAISVNPSLVIESMLATSPSSLNSNQQTSQLQQQAGTSFTQPQILQSNQQQQQQQQQLQTNPLNNNNVESSLTEKLDSLDLDIDSHDLLNDIGLNNWLVMMDSGNNITFNSSGNINITDANTLHDSNRASNL